MKLRAFRRDDIPAVNALHRDVWWPERSHEGWAWLEANPAAQAIKAPMGWVMEDEENAVRAFLGNFVQRFWRGNQIHYGCSGFSVIVPPSARGASRPLISTLLSQPGMIAHYTLNANSVSSPIYKKFGMVPFPEVTSSLKLSWVINPLSCAAARALRAVVARKPDAAHWLGEQLMPLGRGMGWHGIDPAILHDDLMLVNDLSDTSAYAQFWASLKNQGRTIADRSPAMLRWRLSDPDLSLPPLHLATLRNGKITGHVLAMIAKYSNLEPPTLEILDLVALDDAPGAVERLMLAVMRLAPEFKVAKVRLQVLNSQLLHDLGPWVDKARHEGGWGHCHVQMPADTSLLTDWAPTPFDGDFSFCMRPLPQPQAQEPKTAA